MASSPKHQLTEPDRPRAQTAAVKVTGLSVSRGTVAPVPLLVNASFTADLGQLVVVTGTNGCGKSTLLDILRGALDPDSGDVSLLGTAPTLLASQSRRIRAETVGMMFQRDSLVDGQSALSEVLVGSVGRLKPWEGILHWPRNEVTRARDLMRRFALDNRARQLVGSLSGGQRQALALCRAVLQSPALLLCDEPTNQLDAHSRPEAARLLREVADSGSCVIIVEHDLEHLEPLADAVWALEGQSLNLKLVRKRIHGNRDKER